jgi:hypothetical protein
MGVLDGQRNVVGFDWLAGPIPSRTGPAQLFRLEVGKVEMPGMNLPKPARQGGSARAVPMSHRPSRRHSMAVLCRPSPEDRASFPLPKGGGQ